VPSAAAESFFWRLSGSSETIYESLFSELILQSSTEQLSSRSLSRAHFCSRTVIFAFKLRISSWEIIKILLQINYYLVNGC
jgi:hypothetical protein